MQSLTAATELDEDQIILIPRLAKRWSSTPAVALRRAEKYGAVVYRFNQRVVGIKLRDVLRIEEEISK